MLRTALGESQDDPCPGCKKGGVCRTPKCGRLKLPADHPLRNDVEPIGYVGPSWLNPETRTWENESFAPGPIKGWLPVYLGPVAQQEPASDEMIRQMRERCATYELRGAFVDGWISAENAHGIRK